MTIFLEESAYHPFEPRIQKHPAFGATFQPDEQVLTILLMTAGQKMID
jgi:hypothetical protein